MIKYLSSEADLKNGYHLADIFTKTCFVFGDENIFRQFETTVKEHLNGKSKLERIDEIKQQVKYDLKKFIARFRMVTLQSQETIYIKQSVYRSTTLFIHSLYITVYSQSLI